jgi:hypothetical protein
VINEAVTQLKETALSTGLATNERKTKYMKIIRNIPIWSKT